MHSDWIVPVAELIGLLITIAAVLMRTGALVQKLKDLEDDVEAFKLAQSREVEKLKSDLDRQVNKVEQSVAELRGYLLLRRDK